VLSIGTFHFTLYNQTAACHLNMKNAFILPLESLLSVHEKPAGDHHFVEEIFLFFIQPQMQLNGCSLFPVCSASLKTISFLHSVNNSS
jgi:hypothetical protein